MNYRVAVDEVDMLYKTIQDAAPDKDHTSAYLAGALHALLVNILQDNHEALDSIHRHVAVFRKVR